MSARIPCKPFRHARASFTLTELMIVIAVIGVLASTVLFALYGAVQDAKAARTRAQIAKLHELLMQRWESYRTRAVRVSRTTDRRSMAQARVDAIRELIRLELPDRVSDVMDPVAHTAITPTSLASLPSLARHYYRRSGGTATTWTVQYQGAECLYMIIAEMSDINGSALDFFQEGEIGNVDAEDGDQMPEILDGWGNPIEFVRWPYGFLSGGLGADTAWNTADDDPSLSQIMVNDPVNSPDPFDPLGIYRDSSTNRYPALYPLIYSAGPDGVYDIRSDIEDTGPPVTRLDYGWLWGATPKNNPYYVPTSGNNFPIGTPMDSNNDGEIGYLDNITNHSLGD